jgi:hypothetical protein
VCSTSGSSSWPSPPARRQIATVSSRSGEASQGEQKQSRYLILLDKTKPGLFNRSTNQGAGRAAARTHARCCRCRGGVVPLLLARGLSFLWVVGSGFSLPVGGGERERERARVHVATADRRGHQISGRPWARSDGAG